MLLNVAYVDLTSCPRPTKDVLVGHVPPVFNLGWWYLWWLQHSAAAELLFLKQPHH